MTSHYWIRVIKKRGKKEMGIDMYSTFYIQFTEVKENLKEINKGPRCGAAFSFFKSNKKY
jgi:hypothetical protein